MNLSGTVISSFKEEKIGCSIKRPRRVLSCLGLFLLIILWAIPIIALAETYVDVQTEVEVSQEQRQAQIGVEGSSPRISITSTSDGSGIQKPFPGTIQPQFPAILGAYPGPWKENWNIINPQLYTLLEGFWSIRMAKQSLKDSDIKESVYCPIPTKKLSRLKREKGVNVSFDDKKIPDTGVPIGLVIVKGGKQTTLWHLVGKAVLEVNKRNASWLKIERLDSTHYLTSSSRGLGLAGGFPLDMVRCTAGAISGRASSSASTESEPFLQGVAYGIEKFDAPKNLRK